jgi:anti-sigma factor RsiW
MSVSMEDDRLLQAHADGELDPATVAEVERRIAGEAALRTRYESILSLRRLLRTVPEDDVPLERLQRKIGAVVGGRPAKSRPWQAMAAAVLIGAVLGAAAMATYQGLGGHRNTAGLVVTNHIRGLLAPQPFDIASSDRHAIKPWFTSRLPESPPIVDLGGVGFALVGGRVDVLGEQPVPTVIYRHGGHSVSLTALRGAATVPAATVAGYNVVSWREGEFTYVAVADLPEADLEAFRRAFLAALAS